MNERYYLDILKTTQQENYDLKQENVRLKKSLAEAISKIEKLERILKKYSEQQKIINMSRVRKRGERNGKEKKKNAF